MKARLDAGAQFQLVRVVAQLTLPAVRGVINDPQLSAGLLNAEPSKEGTWLARKTLELRRPTQPEQ